MLTDAGIVPIFNTNMKKTHIVALIVTFGLVIAALNNTIGTIQKDLAEIQELFEAQKVFNTWAYERLENHREVLQALIDHNNRNFLWT